MSTSTAAIHRWLPESVYTATPTGKRQPFDLVTPDGRIVGKPVRHDRRRLAATVEIPGIAPNFHGFDEGGDALCEFVLKSSLTQLGVNANTVKIVVNREARAVVCELEIVAVSTLGVLTLDYLDTGSYIGKVFAADPRRLVRVQMYLERLFDVRDANGHKVVAYDGQRGFEDVRMHNGRCVVMLPVKEGVVRYDSDIHTFLPTVGHGLKSQRKFKELLRLHQSVAEGHTRICTADANLMVRGQGLRMRTMFGRVVDELLPAGLRCASSNLIESHTPEEDAGATDISQGRTFVFVGTSTEELTHIPIEFFTTECFREHVPIELRKTFQQHADNPASLLAAFATMPEGTEPCCTFVSKGGMFGGMNAHDWVVRDPKKDPDYLTVTDPARRLALAQAYQSQQAEFSVLTALASGDITSDGVLLCRYFPSPIVKSLILSRDVAAHLKRIYFTVASRNYGGFLSEKDQGMLIDLSVFGIRTFFVDPVAKEMFEYVRRPHTHTGMFVPMSRREEYSNATFFGVYGSNLVEGDFEAELETLMRGVLELRAKSSHPLLNPAKPIALVTGGGPGAMEVGNRVAKRNGILSCGMFVDFGALARKPGAVLNEQKKNPYVEAFMTYRPEKLVERQSDFNLHFPIFLTGGVGTDFEYALEEVRRKVGTTEITPLVLFGTNAHVANKVGARFKENLANGVIRGSEWLSNVPYVVSTGRQALRVFEQFAAGTLPIGNKFPSNAEGFMFVDPVTLEPKPYDGTKSA